MSMRIPPPLARLVYKGLGRVQWVAQTFANFQRPVPREYRDYDLSKVLRAHRLAVRLGENEEILDVGCGDGILLRDLGLFRSFRRRVGVDLHRPESVPPEVEIQAYNGESLPFPDASFDSVVFAYFLHYLSRDHATRLLVEGCRVARKSVFVFDDSQAEWSFWYKARNHLERLRSDILYRSLDPDRYRSSGDEEMYLTYRGWSELLEKLPRVTKVEVVPLDRISGLIHHTLFQAQLSANPGV
jgi:ubiquinone/menaquinone biosynthesis C-methylase UbiE